MKKRLNEMDDAGRDLNNNDYNHCKNVLREEMTQWLQRPPLHLRPVTQAAEYATVSSPMTFIIHVSIGSMIYFDIYSSQL